MTVTYSIELKVILEEDDSAEEFRLDAEKLLKRDYAQFAGESVTIKTKGID